MTTLRASFVRKYLDPGSSLSEILFGLIMTLTFTLGAGLMLQEEGREGARQLLAATLGCNIAWGIIDGVFYLVGQWFDRSRRQLLGRAIRAATDEAAARSLVANELDDTLAPALPAPEREQIYARIVRHVRQGTGRAVTIDRADFMGAVASFWLVFLASVPAAVPFIFIDDAWLALRVSNALLLGLLFAAGFTWSRYTTASRWASGFAFLLGGTALVLIAIALGG